MVLDWRQYGNLLESYWCLNKSGWFGMNTHCKIFLCFSLQTFSYMSYMICVQGSFHISFGIWQGRGEEKSGRGRLWALSRSTTLVPLSLPTTTSPLPAFLPGPFSFPASCARHSILPGMLFVCRNIIIASTWDTWSKQLRLIVYLNDVRCTLVSSFLIQAGPVRAV